MKRIFFVVLTTIVFLSIPLNVFAQSDYYSGTGKTSLGITPGISEIVLDENIPSTKTITVNNLTNFTLPIKAFVEGLSTKEMQGVPTSILERYDSTKWFKINKNDKDFILAPKESRVITVTITQPINANPGGYYASIIFQPLIPEELYSSDSVHIFTRVASVFLLQVKGDLDESINFRDLKLPFLSVEPSVDYTLILQNSGNTHSRPLTKLLFKELIRNRDYPEEVIQPSLILPGLTSEIKGTYSKLPDIGIVKVSTQTTYGASNELVDSPDRYLIIFPLKYIIGLLILLFVLILLRSKVRKRLSQSFKVLVKVDSSQSSRLEHDLREKGIIKIIKRIFKKKS